MVICLQIPTINSTGGRTAPVRVLAVRLPDIIQLSSQYLIAAPLSGNSLLKIWKGVYHQVKHWCL
jgi:hypothetical protein